ncbi:hypothetical protein V7S43_005677 [Phytophthora oleae]|uniref:Uncharacterized protein n=1 Tax=Phytophthora oleae TaxID=2107226 RepID=A0ABD3FQU9_9STRA
MRCKKGNKSNRKRRKGTKCRHGACGSTSETPSVDRIDLPTPVTFSDADAATDSESEEELPDDDRSSSESYPDNSESSEEKANDLVSYPDYSFEPSECGDVDDTMESRDDDSQSVVV